MSRENLKYPVSILDTTDAVDLVTASLVLKGGLSLGKGLALGGNLKLYGSTSGNVTVSAAANSGTITLTLPSALPSVSGYALVSDTSGVLSWSNVNNSSPTFSTVHISGTADSTDTTSGSLQVSGGLGISKSVNVAETVTSSIAPTLAGHLTNKTYVDGISYVTAGTGLSKSGATLSVNAAQSQITSVGTLNGLTSSGIVSITNTTQSSSATSGALQVSGGVGIVGSAFIGGSITISGALSAPSLSLSTAGTGPTVPFQSFSPLLSTGSFTTLQLGIAGSNNQAARMYFNYVGSGSALNNMSFGLWGSPHGLVIDGSGIVSVPVTTDSSSATSGAFQVAGGVGISKSLIANKIFTMTGIKLRTDTPNAKMDYTIAYNNSGDSLHVHLAGSSDATANRHFQFGYYTNDDLGTWNSKVSINTYNGDISSGSLAVSGTVSISGAITASSSLTVSGAVTASTVPSSGNHLTNKTYVDGLAYLTAGTGLSKTSGTLSVNAAQTQITNLGTLTTLTVSGTTLVPTPVGASEAANKGYVDTVAQGLDAKASVKVASTANVAVSALIVGLLIDGVALASGNRVLLKDQTNGTENGIYVVQSSGAPLRSTDMASGSAASGSFFFVENGTVNKSNGWVVTNTTPNDIIGTDSLTFTQFSGAGQIVDGAGLSKSGNALSVNVDNSSIEISGDTLRISSGALGTGLSGGSGNTINIDAAQTQITSIGTLTGLTSSGIVSVSNTTESTSASTGALQIAGGIGIQKTLYSPQNVLSDIRVTDSIVGNENALIYPFNGNNILSMVGYQNVIGQPYGNGTWYINSSSNAEFFEPYRGFSSTTGWSSLPFYNTGTGSYTGGFSTTDVNTNTVYGGEVIEVGLPRLKYITSITIYPYGGTQTAPSTFIIMTKVRASDEYFANFIQSTPLTWTASTPKTFTLPNAGLYGWIRIVCQTITPGAQPYAQLGFTFTASNPYVAFSGTADSTSTTTGSIQVAGGIGVSGSITASTAPTVGGHLTNKTYVDGLGYITAGIGLTKSGSTLSVNAALTGVSSLGTLTSLTVNGQVAIVSTTDSNSTTTGIVQIAGGVGIAKSLHVGGIQRITASDGSGQLQLVPTIAGTTRIYMWNKGSYAWLCGQPTAGDNDYVITLNSGASYFDCLRITTYASIIIPSITNATSTTTGALQMAGGAGIAGNIFVGGNVFASTAPTSEDHLTNKTYVDGLVYLTAGTGLTKSGANLSVNAAQTQITSVGTLSGLTSSGIVVVTNTTDSSSATTGALQINGGIGMSGNLYISKTSGDIITIQSNSATNKNNILFRNANTGSLGYVGLDGAGLLNYVHDAMTIYSPTGKPLQLFSTTSTNVLSSTASTSTTTGALQVSGGVGIVGSVHIGGSVTSNSLSISQSGTGPSVISQLFAPSLSTGSFATLQYGVAGTSNQAARMYFNYVGSGSASNNMSFGLWGSPHGLVIDGSGLVSIPVTSDSTSTTSGTLQVAGGVGIAKRLNVGGILYISANDGLAQLQLTPTTAGAARCFMWNKSSYAWVVGQQSSIDNDYVITLNSGASYYDCLRVTTALNVVVISGTDSTSVSTGAFQVIGGACIAKTVNIGNHLNIGAATTFGRLNMGPANNERGIVQADSNHAIFLRYNNAGISSKMATYSYGDIEFYTNGLLAEQTLKLSISSAGDVLVLSTTDSTSATTGTFQVAGGVGIAKNTFMNGHLFVGDNTTAGDGRVNIQDRSGTAVSFYVSTTKVGSITTTSSTTSYNTTSDHRLKENVVTLSNARERLDRIPVYRYNFINESQTKDGFLAHELGQIIPEAVTGDYNAVDSNGKIIPQSVDYSKIVPLLVAALKEAFSEIDKLKSLI